MTTQPEALRLAYLMEDEGYRTTANELLRQHAEIARQAGEIAALKQREKVLVEALQMFLENGHDFTAMRDKARAALASVPAPKHWIDDDGRIKWALARIKELESSLRDERQTVRNLMQALREEIEGPTFMGEPVITQPAPSQQAEPVADSTIQRALMAAGCDRLKDFYAVGPVQRAAVESFADALTISGASTHPAPQPLTREEIEELFQQAADADDETHIRFARAIEARIKGIP